METPMTQKTFVVTSAYNPTSQTHAQAMAPRRAVAEEDIRFTVLAVKVERQARTLFDIKKP